jgi:serine/threonine-protein kinase
VTRRWQDKYDRIRDVGGGGQGDALVARPQAGGEAVFVKVLRHQNDLMRRKRMHREVEAYRTLEHPGIPALVDSNSHEFEDLEYKLFLASKLIDGPTLTTYVETSGPLRISDAAVLVDRLLDIVAYCHANGYVHRDIKPDNIILRGDAFADPVLVDFGLSFEASNELQQTEHGEELGNRFLRLPELSAGSEVKRDPRSDIAFVAGVFLYCLTATNPSTLADARGKMPHQREGAREHLQASIDPEHFKRLARLFDQAFQMNIDHRYQDASGMKRDLSTITAAADTEKSNADRVKELKKRMGAGDVAYEKQVVEKLNRAMNLIRSAMNEVQKQFDLSNSQTGFEMDPALRIAKNSLALMPHGRKVGEYIRFTVEVFGDELVFSAAYRDKQFRGFGRLPFSKPFNDSELDDELQAIFLSQLEDAVP